MIDKNKTMLILDSGAYSAWTQKVEIDIDEYIAFCNAHPGVCHYANLDVIPAMGTEGRAEKVIEECCERGWQNYQKMVREVKNGLEKVIPVYHRGESVKWLERYLEFGSPYIGIGQVHVFGGKRHKKDWIGNGDSHKLAMGTAEDLEDGSFVGRLRNYIVDSSGKRLLKLHGFGMTSFDLMKTIPWHSVDSISWLSQAAYGDICVPYKDREGNWDYSRMGQLVGVSPRSPHHGDVRRHIGIDIESVVLNKKPLVPGHPPLFNDTMDFKFEEQPFIQRTMEYLKDLNMPLGEYEIEYITSGVKRKLKKGEYWMNSEKTAVMIVRKKGVITDYNARLAVNAKFFRRANMALDIDHIYLAGGEGSVAEKVEFNLGKRLMSFFKLRTYKTDEAKGRKYFLEWCRRT